MFLVAIRIEVICMLLVLRIYLLVTTEMRDPFIFDKFQKTTLFKKILLFSYSFLGNFKIIIFLFQVI
jgi:hypothetical protein